jgi:hypothetical protein
LTEKKKLDIDNQVRKNRLELRFAVFFPLFPFPMFPLPAFINGREIIRRGLCEVDKRVIAPINQFVDDVNDLREEYNVYSAMSKTMSKIADKARKDEETKEGLEKLREQLKDGNFHGGRGAQKLEGTKTVFYMRSGGKA